MLRAVRFSTQLGFKLEKNTFAAIKTRAKYIQGISGERIKSELDKILASEQKERGVRLLDEIGLLRFIMPEVHALKKVHHKSKHYHLEGSVFEHAMLVLKNSPIGDSSLAYAALYHDAGKAQTAVPRKKPEGWVNSFWNHENVSSEMFLDLAQRLRFSRKEKDFVLWITKMHMMRVPFVRDMRKDKKLALARHKYFPQLIEMWRMDQLGKLIESNGEIVSAKPDAYQEGLKLLRIINSKKKITEKIATGKLVMEVTGIISGPKVGAIKNILENKIIYGEIKNISQAKDFLRSYNKIT
jgi:tRNA nucleotidyltransferase/poly(A) polymerase